MLALATMVALGAPTVDRLAPYRGQPVLTINIDAPGEEEIESLRALIDIKPGFLLSTVDLQNTIKRLYALGRFANVIVTAERLSGVVILHFYLQPIRTLGELEIVGLDEADEDALRAAIGFTTGSEIDSQSQVRIQKQATAHLRAAGFPRAEVTVELTAENEVAPKDATVTVVEGAPSVIGSIEFPGRSRVSADVLRDLMASAVEDVVDAGQLEADRAELEKAYQERGFRQAVVGEPMCTGAGDRSTPCAPCRTFLSASPSPAYPVAVYLPTEAGDRIAVQFVGNTLFTDESLMELWPQGDRGMRPETLRILRGRIEDQYERHGYIGSAVQIRAFRDRERGLVRYLFRVAEAEPTRIESLQFVGAEAIDPELLREQVEAKLIRELDPSSIVDVQQLSAADTEIMLRSVPEYGHLRPAQSYQSKVPAEQRWVPRIFGEALDELTAVYKDSGYVDARVDLRKPVMKEGRVRLTVDVTEGPRATIASVSFRRAESMSAGELLEAVEGAVEEEEDRPPVKLGGPLSPSAVEDGRIALVRAYRDQGFLYSRVFTEILLSEDKKSADIVYRMEEGPQVRVENVLVSGNRYTLTGIIESRITIQPGDVYRLEQAVKDRRAISRLGVFSSVRVKLIDDERPAERKDLVAEVVERDRHAIDLMVGLSTADGIRLGAAYSHLNVLGTAAKFTGSLKVNRQLFFSLYGEFEETMRRRYAELDGLEELTRGIERFAQVGISSPPLLFLPLDPTVRLEVINERDNTVRYQIEASRAVLGIDLFITDGIRFSLDPQLGIKTLECPLVESTTGPIIIPVDANSGCGEEAQARRRENVAIQEGLQRSFRIGPRLVLDFRNSPFRPTSGLLAGLQGIYALGDSRAPESRAEPDPQFRPFSFFKIEGGITGYFKLIKPVLALSVRAGHIAFRSGEGVPVDDRFDLGGRDTLRGYFEETLIPQDACVLEPEQVVPAGCIEPIRQERDSNGDLLPPISRGGNTFVMLKAELRVPLTESISVGFFVDTGNLWVDIAEATEFALRFGVGAGLRIATPVGALVFDVGVNPSPRKDFLETGNPLPHFSVGEF